MRNLVLVLALILGALVLMYFWVGVPTVYQEKIPEAGTPHLAYDQERLIKNIHISAFYFVPKNKINLKLAGWKEVLENNLKKLQAFHELQFRGRSHIEYSIYSEPVVGMEDNLKYDTESTEHGNQRALLSVAEELDRRSLVKREGDAYPVMFIMYEGVGASGGVIYESNLESTEEISKKLGLSASVIFKVNINSVDGFFIVARKFLADPEYVIIGVSTLAHEFYHTLGLEDKYEVSEAAAFESVSSQDLMGSGRKASLNKTYLGIEALKLFGL